MSRIKISHFVSGARGRVLANAASRAWNGVISLVLLPIYLFFMGPEAFGVVSAFGAVYAVIALFDCSLAPSLTRELARTRAGATGWQRARDLTRTMEVIYAALSLTAGIAFTSLVPIISGSWLNPDRLSASEVSVALYIGAFALAVQWPSTLYAGGLVGLEKQIPLAVISIASAPVRGALTVFCLWAISPSVETFFWVAAVLGLAQTIIMRHVFWRYMPEPEGPSTFRIPLLAEIWRFAMGVSVITISSVLLLQADKLALSKLLPLEDFGYYTISVSLANALFIVTGAVFTVTFPRLTELAASGDRSRLAGFYHMACQGVALAILPASAVMAFFSSDLLFMWTRDAHIAEQGQWILTVFVLGNVFNCLVSVPYTVQLAYGITRVTVIANLVSLFLAFPLIVMLFDRFGSLSGPITWVVVNLGLLCALTATLHYQALRGEGLKWLVADTGLPVIASFAGAGVVRMLLPSSASSWYLASSILVAWLLATSCSLAVLPGLRRALLPTAAR